MKNWLLISVVCACGFASPLEAGTLTLAVPNFSFENPGSSTDSVSGTPGGPSTVTSIQDWTVALQNESVIGTLNYSYEGSLTGGTGAQGAFISTNYEYYQVLLTTGNGTNNDGSTAGANGYVATVLPSTTYTLTAAVGVPSWALPPSGSDAPGVVLSLVDSDGNTVGSQTIPYSALTQGSMTDETLTFTTGASPSDQGEGMKIQLQVNNGYNNNSTGPAVFDNVRLTESGPNINNPCIFHSSETAGPGDVIGLQGDNFGNAPQVWMHHVTGSEGSLSPTTQLTNLNATNTSVSAMIPETETPGLYAIWIVSGGTQTGPVFVNQARSWGALDLAGTSIDPSRSFRLFGRNLCLPGATPTVTFVNGTTSIAATVTTTGSDSYSLHVTAPSTLTAGTVYTVNVSNGFGGSYGQTALTNTLTGQAAGTDVFGLGVPWGSDAEWTTINATVFNVKTGYGAVGDGVTDDTTAIQNAVFAAGYAGGTVYFPAGTYLVHVQSNFNSAIQLVSNVVLKGAGMASTQIVLRDNGGVSFATFVNCNHSSHVGLMGISFYNTLAGTPYSVSFFNGCTNCFALNAQFQADAGKNLSWTYNLNSVIRNCSIISGTSGEEPTYFQSNTDTVFSNNTISYYWARLRMMTSVRTLVENNTASRIPASGGWESGGYDISCDQQLALVGNTLNKSGSGNFAQNNDGETILSQGDGDPAKVISTVSTATATTLTDTTQSWVSAHYTDHNTDTGDPNFNQELASIPGQTYYVAIVSGPGAGQIRQVVGNTANTLTIDHPWDEMPTSSSNYSLTVLQDHQVIVENNNLSNNRMGMELYATSLLDVSIANNTLNDNGGIALISFNFGPGAYPYFNTVMDTVVNGNTVSVDSSNPYTASDAYAQIFLQTFVNNGPEYGTASYVTEFRHNTINAPSPNQASEGYYAIATWSSYAIDQNPASIANVGTIFQGNTAVNTDNAYRLGTGDINSVIWDPTDTNVGQMLDDVPGLPTINASVNTALSSYDLAAGWNTTSDSTANIWSYGVYGTPGSPGTFSIPSGTYHNTTDLTGLDVWFLNPTAADPNVEKNVSASDLSGSGIDWAPGKVAFGPYTGPAVARFTVPFTGHYHITGAFQTCQIRGSETGDGTTGYVYIGNTNAFTQTLSDPGAAQFGTVANYTATSIALTAGQTIDFVVGNGAFTTQVDATLTRVAP